MYTSTSLFAALLLSYPLGALSQASTTAPDTSQQTLVPFSTLPACAKSCGPLYDAQGACSPPVVPKSSDSCFCAYGSLQPFYKTTNGVCDNACQGDPTGLTKIQQWFLGLCTQPAAPSTATISATSGASAPTSSTAPGSSSGDGSSGDGSSSAPTTGTKQSWISNHWQWILMVVILALAISIGWISACILRRRYLRRKEREYELRPPAAPWAAGQPTHNGSSTDTYGGSGSLAKGKEAEGAAPGMFMPRPPSAARINEKSERKKWVVKERT